MVLSPTELAQLQADAAALLDVTSCAVQRATLADDGYGHLAETWGTIATVTCGLAEPSAGIMTQFAGVLAGSVASWIVSLPLGTDVARNDRLIVGGQTMRVQAVLAPPQSYAILSQVLATELR